MFLQLQPPVSPLLPMQAPAGPPKLVVFGGRGFVGSAVCKEALKTGLHVVSITPSGEREGTHGSSLQRRTAQHNTAFTSAGATVWDVTWGSQLTPLWPVLHVTQCFEPNQALVPPDSSAASLQHLQAASRSRCFYPLMHKHAMLGGEAGQLLCR